MNYINPEKDHVLTYVIMCTRTYDDPQDTETFVYNFVFYPKIAETLLGEYRETAGSTETFSLRTVAIPVADLLTEVRDNDYTFENIQDDILSGGYGEVR